MFTIEEKHPLFQLDYDERIFKRAKKFYYRFRNLSPRRETVRYISNKFQTMRSVANYNCSGWPATAAGQIQVIKAAIN